LINKIVNFVVILHVHVYISRVFFSAGYIESNSTPISSALERTDNETIQSDAGPRRDVSHTQSVRVGPGTDIEL
jgi:hypothetical protein